MGNVKENVKDNSRFLNNDDQFTYSQRTGHQKNNKPAGFSAGAAGSDIRKAGGQPGYDIIEFRHTEKEV